MHRTSHASLSGLRRHIQKWTKAGYVVRAYGYENNRLALYWDLPSVRSNGQ